VGHEEEQTRRLCASTNSRVSLFHGTAFSSLIYCLKLFVDSIPFLPRNHGWGFFGSLFKMRIFQLAFSNIIHDLSTAVSIPPRCFHPQFPRSAVYFDVDVCSAPSPLPHVLPSVEQFDAYVQALGINNGDALVIYDTSDNHIWYMADPVQSSFQL
jgi:hypothetical protein